MQDLSVHSDATVVLKENTKFQRLNSWAGPVGRNVWQEECEAKNDSQPNYLHLTDHNVKVWQELLFPELTKSREGQVRQFSMSDRDPQVL